MKIVRIIARLSVGGPAQHVVWLAHGLRQLGYETVLVCGTPPAGEDDMAYVAHRLGVAAVVIREMSRELSPADVVVTLKLFRLFVRERPDVIHSHTAKAGAVGRTAAVLYRIYCRLPWVDRPRPIVVHTYHGHVFHGYYGRMRSRVFLLVERLLARIATDRIIVISQQQREEIHHRFGVGRDGQFAIIPLGLDLTPYAAAASRRAAARTMLGLGVSDLAVGIVGRLVPVKNHQLFLDAVADRIADSAGDSRSVFFIVGDGPLRAALEAQATRLGSRVRFVGTRADMPDIYAALDLVALSSLNEGTPLSLIEAMASGKPFVSTDVGGVRDLAGAPADPASDPDRRFLVAAHGVLVGSRDAAAFAAALAYLESRPETRRVMGESGRHFVFGAHDLSRLLGDVVALYERGLSVRG